MAYSATLAHERGLLSNEEHRRILDLFSKAGLSMDHHQFDESILDKGTKAILKTRDGLLRAAVPNPLGSCVFLNDVSHDELCAALRKHKQIMKGYPRKGEGIEAFVDASDTGYTMNPYDQVETTNGSHGVSRNIVILNEEAPKANGMNGVANGMNGHANGAPVVNGQNGSVKSKVNGINGVPNGINGHSVTNGVAHDRE